MRNVEKTKVELLLGKKRNKKLVARTRHLRNYMLNLFLNYLHIVKGKKTFRCPRRLQHPLVSQLACKCV